MTDTFDVHAELHQRGPVDGCRECEINRTHATAIAHAATEHGGVALIPRDVMTAIQESTRLTWCEFVDGNTTGVSIVRHDKTAKLLQLVKERHGQQVTVQEMMFHTGAADGTVYGIIRDNPLNFRKVGIGTYIVIDEAAVRAAAKSTASAPGLAAAGRGGADDADAAAADVAAFLAPTRRTFAGPAPA